MISLGDLLFSERKQRNRGSGREEWWKRELEEGTLMLGCNVCNKKQITKNKQTNKQAKQNKKVVEDNCAHSTGLLVVVNEMIHLQHRTGANTPQIY